MKRVKLIELRPRAKVKWPACGHSGWWQVERIDSKFVRIERGGVSQYVPAAALRVPA
jgi:hypothetical protein